MTPEGLARLFHETYERLAPDFGYETRPESAVPWDEVPERNRALMVAVAGEVIAASPFQPNEASVDERPVATVAFPNGIMSASTSEVPELVVNYVGGVNLSMPVPVQQPLPCGNPACGCHTKDEAGG